MRWLVRIVRWRSKLPPVIRWLAALLLFSAALGFRLVVGMFHGLVPVLAFYPMLLIVTVLFGWKEGFTVLLLSAIAGTYLRLPQGYLQPIGWLLVGSMQIVIISTLQTLAYELSDANERQRILFNEMQHRTANTLQSVVGTLDMARRRVDSAPEHAKRILDDGMLRISASADVHRRLHDPKLLLEGLTTILHDAMVGIVDAEVQVGLDIMPLNLSVDQLSVIAMIVIEVANNSQKHVFRHKLGRHFLVSLRQMPRNRATLMVKDDGPDWTQDAAGTERSLGLSILQGLAQQLRGTLSITCNKGTLVSVAFPLS